MFPFTIGTLIGLVAGYYGGWVDTITNWLVNVVVAFPFYVLIIALVFALGSGTRNIYIAITIVGWVSYTRIIRGEVLVAKRRDYVLAAKSGGLSDARILFRHLLPNVVTQAIVFACSDIVLDILAIVTLGYLGLGVQPPNPDWGRMIADGQTFLTTHWELSTVPGIAVVDHRARPVAARRRARRPAEARMSEPLLRVRDLQVEFQLARGTLRAVDGASFDVHPGEALGLVGESGSGKTVALRALVGLLPRAARITGGTVEIDGVDVTAASEDRRRELRGTTVSMIFQEPMTALNPVMRVGEQIAEVPLVRLGQSRREAKVRALELMRLVGIPDPARRAEAYPHELSGGMRQRVMIAIALSGNPRLILCDEPTTALDVTIQDQILKLLQQLQRELDVALVFVSHDLAVVAQTSRRVAVMYAGQIVETGTVADVFREPRHPYTLGLLRSVPDFDVVRETLSSIPGAPPDLASPPRGCRFHPRCQFVQTDCLEGAIPLLELGERARRQVPASRSGRPRRAARAGDREWLRRCSSCGACTCTTSCGAGSAAVCAAGSRRSCAQSTASI